MGFHLVFKSNFEPISEGVHTAVCDKIIDLGEQVGAEKFGSKICHQYYIGWQIADDGPDIRYTGKIYNLSKDKKATLRKDLEAWQGKAFAEGEDFDSDVLLGKGCQLQIAHVTGDDGKVRDRVQGIMALPKGVQIEPPAETVNFELTKDTWQELDSRIPEWIQKIIKQGLTYQQLSQEEDKPFGPDQGDDALPF